MSNVTKHTFVNAASDSVMNVFVSFSASSFVNLCLGSPTGYLMKKQDHKTISVEIDAII